MFTSLAGRAVVVTGGTRGIGKGIASVFARNGARVLITGRDSDVARAAAEELSADGAEVSFIQTDVSSREDCRRMAANAIERLGGIDVLCANAGVFPDSLLADMTEDLLDQVLGTNLKGTVFSVQACLDALKLSGRGRVILTSSITGPITGYPGWTGYGASKAGQLGFMRTAAIELAQRISANAPLAVAASKRLLLEMTLDLEPAWQRQRELTEPVFASEDAREGATAFAEKRAAVWRGR